MEQTVADACISGEDDIDEWTQPYRPVGGKIEHKQQVNLAGLVKQADDSRNGKPESRLRTSEIRHDYSAALRMASHSRSACASRGETSGY